MTEPTMRAKYTPLPMAARRVRIPAARVRRLVRAGLVQPAKAEGREVLFGETELARLRKIRRLSEDLGLSSSGVEVVLRLLDEIDALRQALNRRTGNHVLTDDDRE